MQLQSLVLHCLFEIPGMVLRFGWVQVLCRTLSDNSASAFRPESYPCAGIWHALPEAGVADHCEGMKMLSDSFVISKPFFHLSLEQYTVWPVWVTILYGRIHHKGEACQRPREQIACKSLWFREYLLSERKIWSNIASSLIGEDCTWRFCSEIDPYPNC